VGAEFIEKAAPSFTKAWDRARVKLGTADLFTRVPDCAPRTAEADIIDNAKLSPGDQLTVESKNGMLIARRGTSDVARFTNPAAELVQAVAASCGIARGTVQEVYSVAGVAEISLC